LDNKSGDLKVLAISNLFPNPFEPRRGLFNLNQFGALAAAGVDVKVVAPVPAFPGMGLAPRLASSGRAARVPHSGEVDGLPVWYPRYPYLPLVGREFHGPLYYRGTRKAIGRIIDDWGPDVLYVTWTWPDAFAAGLIARDHGLPYVVKVHGTDINEYLGYRMRKRRILSALNNASGIVSVSGALKEVMSDQGIDADKIHVIYNGVDRNLYRRQPGEGSRLRLGITPDALIIVFVGNLKPVKGLDQLLKAFKELRGRVNNVRLHIIGRGPLESDLRRQTAHLGVDEEVRFEGEQSPEEVSRWMNAADVVCLPSVNEGVPNVLLEAMACGTPVVASLVGGIPEIVDRGRCGFLVKPGFPGLLAEALEKSLTREWDHDEIRGHTEPFTWENNAGRLRGVLESARTKQNHYA
jgi:glycosyltransferase involved in cell wall biosynthesis